MRTLLFAAILFTSAHTAHAGDASRQPMSEPRDIIKLLEASPRQYEVKELESAVPMVRRRNADQFWPALKKPLDCVALKDGKRVVPCQMRPEVRRILEEAEPLYQEKKFVEAEARYAEALKISPNDYQVLLSYGDAAHFRGEFAIGLARYDKAVAANPHDHRGHFYRANALLELGRKKEALESYATAVALRPRHDLLRAGIEDRAETLGVKPRWDLLLPLANVSAAGDKIAVQVSLQPHWVAFAMCKAAWMAEPEYRKKRTGSATRVAFNSTEELECALNLLAIYVIELEKGAVEREPALDQLARIAEAKMLDDWVLFELATRVDPHLTVIQSKETRDALHAFILRFVLEPVAGARSR